LVVGKGKVVTWQKDYDGGPQRLAKTLTEGLRIADPTFDPSKSPDLSQPSVPKQPDVTPALGITPNQAGSVGLVGLASVAGWLVYRNRRR
jgi:hypothetical protein